MNDLITTINYTVSHSIELKNKFTDATSAPVEFACIFCQNQEEYNQFTNAIQVLGKIVQDTRSGFTYLLNDPLQTTAGNLRLVKIRKPDPNRPERGDADFNTDYSNFENKYQNDPKFELIKRENFEMPRLSDKNYNVMACFSSIPASKYLYDKI